ncbi:MAG: TonB-dependent receptor [Gemmatimonadetes bacterium]|nr:TonB-dependent receptor [Gemmatimonadota bacterium]NNF12337.1 TonB-dependent receptor [Gemmatimonadota bacterium]
MPKLAFGLQVDRVVHISQRIRMGWVIRRAAPAVVAVAMALPLAPVGALAQASTVQGQIRDEVGSAVFGATVLLYRGDRLVHGADTDRLGSFRISEVSPGPYEMRVQALGYAELVQALDVGFATTETLDLRLQQSALELEGISVEAERSRQRRRFEEVPGPTVREMNRSQVRWVPGVAEPDPVRAIEVLPGVVSTSDFSAAFHVRGGSQDQNLILLDGIPIFSPFHLGGLFSVFNADMIDRVELMSGGFAAEHGGRVSSVLDIDSDPGSGDFGVDGAVSLLSSRAAVAGSLPKSFADALGHANVRYRLSARRSYFDVLLKPAFEFPYHLTDLQGVIEGWTRSGGRVTVSAYSGEDVFALTSVDDEDFPLRVDWDWGNDAIGARWTQPRSGGGSIDVRANFSRYGTGLIFPDFGDTEFDSRIQQAQLRTDLDFRPTPRWSFQTGATAQRLSYGNSFLTGGTDFGGGRGTGNLLGSYVQARWSSPRKWLVEVGLRGDLYAPDPGSTVFEPAPRFAVKRFLGSGEVALKMAAGRYTQFLHSLRDEELPLGLDIWVLAGARAPHTVSDQIQVGIEGFRDIDWYWSVEGYLREFDGVVTFNVADDPNDDRDDILGGRGTSWGVDAMLRKETGDVQGWIALSFLKAERTFPDVISPLEEKPRVTYPPIFDRRLDADLVLTYPGPWGWTGGVRWNLGTGIPYTRALGSYAYYQPRYVEGGGLDWTGDDQDASGGYGVVLGARNSSRYPTYHRLDLSFRRTFPKSWGSLTPYLNLVNVYNQRNVLFYFFEYEQDPPVRSGISMFPVLPTFGVEVSF